MVKTGTTTGFEAMVSDLTAILNQHFRLLAPEAREEAVAEGLALAWANWRSLVRRGLEARATAHTLAFFAGKAVAAGRRVASHANSRDVLHMTIQSRIERGVYVAGDIDAATVESRKITPADLAAFRIDFAEFLRSLTDRQRAIALRLAAGFTATQVARVYGVQPAAISKQRQRLERMWVEFQGGA